MGQFKGRFGFRVGLRFQQNAIRGTWRWHKSCQSQTRWQRIAARLLHHFNQVVERVNFADSAIVDLVELAIADASLLAGWGYVQPFPLEATDEIAGAGDPVLGFTCAA